MLANQSIHIVGQGAIGLLLAKYLAPAHPISLISKKLHGEVSFTYEAPTKQRSLFTVNATALPCSSQITQLILPLKAYQVVDAFCQLKTHLSDDAVIVISHNGMGTVESIKSQLTANQTLLFLSTSMGAYKPDLHTLCHTGAGKTFLGLVQGDALWQQKTLVKSLLNTLPDIAIDLNINQLLWRKLLINVAINPLSALYSVKNGALTAPYFCSRVFSLLSEAVTVARADGVSISLAEALEMAYEVMRKTANNNSSMKQDFGRGQHTEIDAICGYVIKKGAQHKIATPFNQQVYQAILDGKPSRS